MSGAVHLIVLVGVQATLLSLLIICCCVAMRFALRASVAPLICAGLTAAIAVWLAAPLPLPSWLPQQPVATNSNEHAEENSLGSASNSETNAHDLAGAQVESTDPQQSTNWLPFMNPWSAKPVSDDQFQTPDSSPASSPRSVAELIGSVWYTPILGQDQSANPSASSARNWTTAIAVLMLGLVGWGGIRFGLALRAIRHLKRNSSQVTDPAVKAVMDEIVDKLGIRRRIELRVSPELQVASTIGFWKPAVFLPANYDRWNVQQLTAVLAHEASHIAHFDFAQHLIAQVATVAHYYNPLVHWLGRRLRLEQEIAADHRAAAVVGDPGTYVKVLAAMALENDGPTGRRVGWLAPMFLPTRKTFFRRIEMLRTGHRPTASVAKFPGWVSAVVVAAMGFAVVGLRPASPSIGLASENERLASRTHSSTSSEITAANLSSSTARHSGNLSYQEAESSLRFVSPKAEIVVSLRPAEMLSQPLIRDAIKACETGDSAQVMKEIHKRVEGLSGTRLENLERLTFAQLGARTTASPPEMLMIARTTGSQREFTDRLKSSAVVKKFRGMEIHVLQEAGTCFHVPGDRTIVWASNEQAMKDALRAKESGPAAAVWVPAWKNYSEDWCAMAVSQTVIESWDRKMSHRESTHLIRATLSPLWEETNFVLAGLRVIDGKIQVHAQTDCDHVDSASRVEETLTGLVPLAKNMLRQARQRGVGGGPVIQLATDALNSATVGRQGESVRAQFELKGDIASQCKLVLSSLLAQQAAAHRVAALNQLRHIALAMHNYHDEHGSFPPAILISPQGHAYSWRVALLPYLEQQKLYESYRFDQPWDSEHNLKVTQEMPSVYRHAAEPNRQSTSSSYYVITGEETIFSGAEGNTFVDITDGTSNTILAVEARRDCHWAKPEDIPFKTEELTDCEHLLEQLGGYSQGGFLAAFGDGSVRFLPSKIEVTILNNLLTRSGGEVITEIE